MPDYNLLEENAQAQSLDQQRYTTISSNFRSEATLEYVKPRRRVQKEDDELVANVKNPIIKNN